MAAEDQRPQAGVPETLEPGLRRILAPNPSPMTYWGTNTYLLGTRDIAVIDPGPASEAHLEAILAALQPGQRITRILVTHSHLDHSPLARPLADRTGAPVLAYGPTTSGRSAVMERLLAEGFTGGGEGLDMSFTPDRILSDGEIIEGDNWTVTALWTPGHMGNHMAFQWKDVVFSGDLVMGWASSLVSPPDGDMAAFLASCARLREIAPRCLHAGHGAPVEDSVARIDWLVAHRKSREHQIRSALSGKSWFLRDLTQSIYGAETPEALIPAAERNVLAHLIDLTDQGAVTATPKLSREAEFSLAPT